MGLFDKIRSRNHQTAQGVVQANSNNPLDAELNRLRGMTETGLKRENTRYLKELAEVYHAYSIMGRGNCPIWQKLCHMKDNYFLSKVDSQAKADELQRKYGQNLNITQVVINARYTSSQASFDHEIDNMIRVLRDFFVYAPVARVAKERGIEI